MNPSITLQPAVEPISTAEAKEWLRIDPSDTSQDAVLAILIKAVRDRVESRLRRSLITRTYSWTADSDDVKMGTVTLPYPPVQSITSFKTYDDSSGSEVETVVDSGDYQLVNGTYLAERGDGWDVNRRDKAAVIVYVAGYGDAATDIPGSIRMVMFEMLALRFERRGDEDRDGVTSREHEILQSIDEYRTIAMS